MQLIVGDFSLSEDQSRAQMALWSIMAAQLMMSNDLRTMAPWAKDILQNQEVLNVNQDPLGIMGKRVLKVKHLLIVSSSMLDPFDTLRVSFSVFAKLKLQYNEGLVCMC